MKERKSPKPKVFFIEKLEFPFKEKRLLQSLCCKQLKDGKKIKLFTKDKETNVENIIKSIILL